MSHTQYQLERTLQENKNIPQVFCNTSSNKRYNNNLRSLVSYMNKKIFGLTDASIALMLLDSDQLVY